MSTDPEPHYIALVFHGHGAVMDADMDRPKASDLSEMQRWMTGILAQQSITTVGQTLYISWQLMIVSPKAWRCAVSHRSVHRPAWRSCIASCARASSRPAATSSSNC